MTDGEWLVELRHTESIFNKKRWDFRNKFKRYIRINPYSDQYSEDELINDLNELKEIRSKMKDISRKNNFKGDYQPTYRSNSDIYFNRAAKPIK